jgi:glycosyltransferase involved in cell wall biosynthesis
MKIALIGNYLPRLCGIATYTTHLHSSLEHLEDVRADVWAMVDPGQAYDFPERVKASINQEDQASYRRAALYIDNNDYDLLWVQHEFGIYGGSAGQHLLTLIDNVSTPLAVTLHTVLTSPSPDENRVMRRLVSRATVLIVMTSHAAMLLQRIYGANSKQIVVVEHGIPDRSYIAPHQARQKLGQADTKTLMTFGLLSPGKGLETVISAMPAILDRCPEAVYHIVGATHPHLLAREGERYRNGLHALASKLGVSDHVCWVNRFVGEEELIDMLQAADVYVTPYRNPQQITSGTLAYASGLGKPVVSTPYVHAVDLISEDRGFLVDFDDATAISEVVSTLLTDDSFREDMSENAFRHGRTMTWVSVVRRTVREFGDRLPQVARRRGGAELIRPARQLDATIPAPVSVASASAGRVTKPIRMPARA